MEVVDFSYCSRFDECGTTGFCYWNGTDYACYCPTGYMLPNCTLARLMVSTIATAVTKSGFGLLGWMLLFVGLTSAAVISGGFLYYKKGRFIPLWFLRVWCAFKDWRGCRAVFGSVSKPNGCLNWLFCRRETRTRINLEKLPLVLQRDVIRKMNYSSMLVLLSSSHYFESLINRYRAELARVEGGCLFFSKNRNGGRIAHYSAVAGEEEQDRLEVNPVALDGLLFNRDLHSLSLRKFRIDTVFLRRICRLVERSGCSVNTLLLDECHVLCSLGAFQEIVDSLQVKTLNFVKGCLTEPRRLKQRVLKVKSIHIVGTMHHCSSDKWLSLLGCPTMVISGDNGYISQETIRQLIQEWNEGSRELDNIMAHNLSALNAAEVLEGVNARRMDFQGSVWRIRNVHKVTRVIGFGNNSVVITAV